MTQFEFEAPADFFSRGTSRRVKVYRRFATTAEAIKHAVECQDAEGLRSTIVESDEDRLESERISELYECVEFPLPRRRRTS